MSIVRDYVAMIEETCGEERDFVVMFKYDKKDEAITKILEKAAIKKSISRIIFELTFRNISFRLYGTGKAIFRNLKDKDELKKVLSDLLL
jgi:ArsR family metal-binding transcriptional regulator